MKKVRLVSPNGDEIIGTSEIVYARVGAEFYRDNMGGIAYEHVGGAKVFWDSMETETDEQGEPLFLCTQGEEWTLEECTVEDDEEKEEDDDA